MTSNKKLVCLIFSTGLLSLSGCSSSGPVKIGKDTYLITKQSAGGMFVAPSSIKAEIINEGGAFCASNGKVLQLVSSNELKAIPGVRAPSAEINFMCLVEDDRDVVRPKMERAPDTITENRIKVSQ